MTLAEMLHHPTESAYREIPSDALYIRVTEGMNNINVGWIWKADGATYLSYYNAGDAELSKEKSGEYPAIYTYDESVFDAFAAELENLIVP